MDIETLRNYCLALKGVEEKMPFDDEVLVFTVGKKMFCLCNINQFDYVNVKCTEELAIQLRETHPEVTPGYHMNKKLWNSIATAGSIPNKLFLEWIQLSYQLVFKGLTKKLQAEITNL
jgi:predicted DNA-binding protein (MmcQ/YjbR family)